MSSNGLDRLQDKSTTPTLDAAQLYDSIGMTQSRKKVN